MGAHPKQPELLVGELVYIHPDIPFSAVDLVGLRPEVVLDLW